MDQEKRRLVIRPVSSKRGTMSLLVCLIIGLVMLGLSLALRWSGVMRAGEFLPMAIIAVPIIGLGLVLYLIFPKARLIFDARSRLVTIKSSRRPDRSISFDALQPFRLVEIVRGFAHQYYCCNDSLGEFSELFFSALYSRTRAKAVRLARLCQGRLFGLEGKLIDLPAD